MVSKCIAKLTYQGNLKNGLMSYFWSYTNDSKKCGEHNS